MIPEDFEKVTQRDQVSDGDTIGYTGFGGWNTGTYLHHPEPIYQEMRGRSFSVLHHHCPRTGDQMWCLWDDREPGEGPLYVNWRSVDVYVKKKSQDYQQDQEADDDADLL